MACSAALTIITDHVACTAVAPLQWIKRSGLEQYIHLIVIQWKQAETYLLSIYKKHISVAYLFLVLTTTVLGLAIQSVVRIIENTHLA